MNNHSCSACVCACVCVGKKEVRDGPDSDYLFGQDEMHHPSYDDTHTHISTKDAPSSFPKQQIHTIMMATHEMKCMKGACQINHRVPHSRESHTRKDDEPFFILLPS